MSTLCQPAWASPSEGLVPWTRWLVRIEDSLLVMTLAAAVMLPLCEVVLRKGFSTGIPSGGPFLQHLTLVIGMLGGAVAARQRKLLSLSALNSSLRPKMRKLANAWSGLAAAAIAGFLCSASVQFVLSEREAGNMIIPGVPVWWFQLCMPLGFALISFRLLWHSSGEWKGRVIGSLVLLSLSSLALLSPDHAVRVAPWALGLLLMAAILGAPIFAVLGGTALILFWSHGQSIAVVPLTHYTLVTNPTLPTIPLFTLAGYFLAEGGASQRLVRVFQACLGGRRGGPALITTLACAFFTAFTGASGVTILALGALLIPLLRTSGYSERTSLGLVTAAGSLGMLFPPCLPLLLYSIVASANAGPSGAVTMEQMFLGGLGPGFLLVAITAVWGWRAQPVQCMVLKQATFSRREAFAAIRAAVWELLLPVVAFVALFGGFATPVEAAALTAFYAFMVEVLFHRNTQALRDAPRVVVECGLLVGGVLLIFGVALAFTNYLVDIELPEQLVTWTTHTIHSKWIFLLCLNVVLLAVGGLIEIYAAIVVVVPLLIPLGNAFGLNPIHLGIIFLANMELGFLAPPVGLNLLLASSRFKKPVFEVMRAVFPMLVVLFIGVLLITYFPPLTTWLPSLFSPSPAAPAP